VTTWREIDVVWPCVGRPAAAGSVHDHHSWVKNRAQRGWLPKNDDHENIGDVGQAVVGAFSCSKSVMARTKGQKKVG
jgi:hypothetical protein